MPLLEHVDLQARKRVGEDVLEARDVHGAKFEVVDGGEVEEGAEERSEGWARGAGAGDDVEDGLAVGREDDPLLTPEVAPGCRRDNKRHQLPPRHAADVARVCWPGAEGPAVAPDGAEAVSAGVGLDTELFGAVPVGGRQKTNAVKPPQ